MAKDWMRRWWLETSVGILVICFMGGGHKLINTENRVGVLESQMIHCEREIDSGVTELKKDWQRSVDKNDAAHQIIMNKLDKLMERKR